MIERLKRYPSKENRRLQINIWKDAQHHTSILLENCKFKQWDITKHLLEGLKSKTRTPPNTNKDIKQQERIAGGNAATLKDSLAVSYKTRHLQN